MACNLLRGQRLIITKSLSRWVQLIYRGCCAKQRCFLKLPATSGVFCMAPWQGRASVSVAVPCFLGLKLVVTLIVTPNVLMSIILTESPRVSGTRWHILLQGWTRALCLVWSENAMGLKPTYKSLKVEVKVGMRMAWHIWVPGRDTSKSRTARAEPEALLHES